MAGGEAAAAVVCERRPLGVADVGGVTAARDGNGSLWADRRGSAPRPRARSARAAPRPRPSIAGIAESSASVYGWIGCRKSASDGPSSTTTPRYITAIRSDVVDDAEVVRDEDVRQVELVLQVVEQVDHLRLDRDVERRDRLVRDDQLRVQGERARATPIRCRCPPENSCGYRLAWSVTDRRSRSSSRDTLRVSDAARFRRRGSGTGPRGSGRRACAD